MKHDHLAKEEHSFKAFLPLIIIFSIIILLSIVRPLVVGAWNLHAFMYDFMGIFFIVFGSFKMWNLDAFAEAYSTYDLIAQRSKFYAYAYPFIEITLGILYLVRWNLTFVNSCTCIIMLINTVGVAKALATKKRFQCACLGTVFKIPMTYVTLIEDMLMAGMAAIMLFYKIS